MISRAIRTRMLATAIVPVALVVLVVVSVFWSGRRGDLDESYRQRARLLVRQAAVASEYGVFSGNIPALQGVVNGVRREPDVVTVVVFDASGILMVSAGAGRFTSLDELLDPKRIEEQAVQGVDVLAEAIVSAKVPLDDLFATQSVQTNDRATALGHVVIEVSRENLGKREGAALFVAVWVGLAGILLGALLAVQMGRGVVNPILRVSQMIKRIGKGDFSAHPPVATNDPLYDLQADLDQMATRLAWGRDELEQRVASVTQALRQKKDEAEQATLAKSRFLAAASHDLRQPTHALGMFVARLSQMPMEAPMRRLVGNLDDLVQSMQDLLDGLLDLSRLDAGAVRAHLEPVSMRELCNALRNTFEPMARDKGLRLVIRTGDFIGLSDPVLLQRMVVNLAHNALRYTERGCVLIACRPTGQGSMVRIEVWDSGVGIAPEHQSSVFKEFYQVGNAGRDRKQGLGLGLNIVERTAQLLGHGITLRSQVGRGSRFAITLPRIEGTAVQELQAEKPSDLDAAGLEGFTVLVIEDDDFAREAMFELLTSWGCVVHLASTAEQARSLATQLTDIAVILSDYRLGEAENGLEVIAALRGLVGRDIAACVMSGDMNTDLMQAVKHAGLTLLHKPVRPAKLRSLLRRLSSGPGIHSKGDAA